MVVFRHLMGTPHKRALFDRLDKLFDERVLLGTAVASHETLRSVARSVLRIFLVDLFFPLSFF